MKTHSTYFKTHRLLGDLSFQSNICVLCSLYTHARYLIACSSVKPCPNALEALGKYNQDLCIKYGVVLGGGQK